MSTQIKTGLVRFSYPAVFTPKAIKGSTEEKYSVSIIIPKTDTAQIAMIEAAIVEAWEQGKAKGYFKSASIPADKNPLKDGDNMKDDEGAPKNDPAYAGCRYMTAYGKHKPGLVDKHRDAQGALILITNPDDFYPGCFGRAAINFYPFGEGKKGVAVGLNNIQKIKDGPRLDGRKDANSDFNDDFADNFSDDDYDYTPEPEKPKNKPAFDPNDL